MKLKYLYGNSNESDLDQNYLEFLRLALDFSVAVLMSETKISELQEGMKEAEAGAAVERAQIAVLGDKVFGLLDNATDAESTAVTVACVNGIRTVAQGEITLSAGTIESTLNNYVGRANAEISAERTANIKRLETVLLSCDLPKCVKNVDVILGSSGRYSAKLESVCDEILRFETNLLIPDGNLFSEVFRVDKMMPNLQISMPEAAGLFKKGTKIVSHKLSKEYVCSLEHKTGGVLIELRNAPKDGHSGYDILFRGETAAVTRIVKQQGGDPYEVGADDLIQLHELYHILNSAANKLQQTRQLLSSASIDGVPLASHPEPDQMVLWLLGQMAPVVKNISKNSLSPTELVLKRVLSDDRREEIFASKAELYAKLAPLTDAHKECFAPLGLDSDNQKGLPMPKPVNLRSEVSTAATSEAAPFSADASAPAALSSAALSSAALPSAAVSSSALSETAAAEGPGNESSIDEIFEEELTSEIDLEEIEDSAPVIPPPVAKKSGPSVPPPRPSSGPPPLRSTPPRTSKLPPPSVAPKSSKSSGKLGSVSADKSLLKK